MYEQDYFMRMISSIIRFLVKVFLKKDTVNYELSDTENYTQTDYIHKQLLRLIKEGKINEAEDMLFEKLEPSNKRYMELALDFYERLNSLEDEFLEKNNFTREEVGQGLEEIAKEFGISEYLMRFDMNKLKKH